MEEEAERMLVAVLKREHSQEPLIQDEARAHAAYSCMNDGLRRAALSAKRFVFIIADLQWPFQLRGSE
eukprot:3797978-Pleurochrysis_carterae.AAC.1